MDSMERGQFKKYHGQGSRFMGAILMSNRVTKQECIQRKLFGLPSSMAWFMKRIKSGMLLFLFEHEERKLYGVFEATSDGAMNIMPNAFISSGNPFPAQILFRRVWMCKPLFESEFCDAIRENYFARGKFNFGLSYEQVVKLIHLFSLKRINVKQHSRPGIPNEIIKQFEKYDRGRVVSQRNGEPEFVSHEHVMNDGTYSRRYLGGPGPKTNNSMSQVKFTKKHFSDKFGNGLEQMDPDSTKLHPPHLLGYESSLAEKKVWTSNNLSVCRNSSELLVNPHSSLDFRGQNLTGTLSMDYRTHPQEPIKYSPPKSVVSSSLICDPSGVSLSLLTSESHPNFCDQNRYESQDECYDPLNPMISFSPGSNVARRTEALGSVHSSGSRHETSRHEFDSTGQPCEDSDPLSDYIPLPGTNCIDRNVDSFNLNSVQNDMPANCSSDSEENFDFEGLRPFVATAAEEYYPPAAVSSRLHSDIEQNRTSVFFRLAKTTEHRHKYEGLQKPISSLSLDQLVGILSQRRNQLNEMTKAPKPSIVQDDDVEKRQSNVSVEISNMPYPDEVELSDGDIFVDDAIAEENSDELFLNFKRRSDIRKLSTKSEMDTRSETETGPVEEILHKRRKLVRPSFNEEGCRNVQCSSHEIVGDNINSSDADNSPCDAAITDKNVKRSEGSRNSPLSSDKKSSSASEASLREESSESLRTRQKEISNRNLRWFLRKSIDSHVKSSNGVYMVDKEKSASQMAGGVLLPAHSKCKDQETDCFSDVNLTSLIDGQSSHE